LIRNEIQRCEIYSEFSKEEQKEYFSYKSNKVIHNIDTLYYSAYLDEEIAQSRIEKLVAYLSSLAVRYQTGETLLSCGELSFYPFHFSIYEYCLRLENMFDIFISKYLPNKNTPRVVVQLRSVGLWLNGAKGMIEDSCKALETFLKTFEINVMKITENRIDYAFHTNIIQNTTKFFSDRNLQRSLKSDMTIYHKVGNIGRQIEVDYLSLGNRKSNNIFFRAYNKTKEVVEKNYKGFFIEYWHKSGLISNYDKWILEKAYERGSFNGLLVARIEWYLEHGHDESKKKKLKDLYKKCYEKSDNSTFIADALSGLLPEATIVCNIEFQTKRKFYFTMNEYIDNLPCSVPKSNIYCRIFQIIENPKPFLDYLTSSTVSFIQGDKYASWWNRIRTVKIKTLSNGEVCREYMRNLDIEKLKQRMIGTIAAGSVYKNKCNDNSFTEDVSDMICILNDNDVAGMVLNTDTGEFLDFKYLGYETVKKRKNRQLKALLEKHIKRKM